MRSLDFVTMGLAVGIVWAQGAVAQNVPSPPPTVSLTLAQVSPSTAGSSVRRAPIGLDSRRQEIFRHLKSDPAIHHSQ